MNIQIINVKLPFIEAIEHLQTDKNAIGCVCLNDSRPCVISRTKEDELRIIENDLFLNCEKTIEELATRLLSIDNILKHEWQMIYKLIE